MLPVVEYVLEGRAGVVALDDLAGLLTAGCLLGASSFFSFRTMDANGEDDVSSSLGGVFLTPSSRFFARLFLANFRLP